MSSLYLPEAHIKKRYYDFSSLKTLISNGIWNSINSLGNSLNSGLDLLITNLMLSATGVGQISICKTVSNIVFAMYGVLGQPFHPGMLRSYSSGNIPELMNTFKKAMQICGLFTNIVFAGFVALGIQFYSLWIPTQDIHLVYKLTIIALFPCISEGCVYPLLYIYTLTVKNKVPCIITIIGGLINVMSMYFLIKHTSLGLYAVLLTTAVIMNVIYFVTSPIYMAKCLNIKAMIFYRQIIRNIVSCLVATIILYSVSRHMSLTNSWIVLIQNSFILLIIGIIVQFLFQYGFKEISCNSNSIVRRFGK